MVELPTDYQTFIHQSKYARWNDAEGRRENWNETVARYFDFFGNHLLQLGGKSLANRFNNYRKDLELAVLNLEVVPSMRAIATAGPALERDNVAGYNCAYAAVDNPKVFDEILYTLCCGTGFGFSVERQNISQLPAIAEEFHESESTIVVPDSKIGWATGFRELISFLYAGKIPTWDLSRIRPKGARLKTFGGRASGPDPLDELFRFTVETFRNAAGRKLNSLECHDIICKTADSIVVGGVRRSALISLSNVSDDRMRVAKSGQWFYEHPYRALANNSAVYTDTPDMGVFMKEWVSLYESKSGERGIFNRLSAKRQAERNGRRDTEYEFGCNPCSEIILRSKQFCNLSEVVVRKEDNLDTLRRKVQLATILGTLQATLTDFRYLSKAWRQNTEDERLLGVSLTGICDNRMMVSGNQEVLEELKNEAIKTNKEFAKMLGIPASAAITCVKPSGTVSQLVDSSSGIHTRHSPFYIRRVRSTKTDPLGAFLRESGVPCEDDLQSPDYNSVFSFPIAAPKGAVCRNDKTAIEQLELWKKYQEYWCEHKPSVTISVKEPEWMSVGAWVYDNFDSISGISFLPYSGHTYKQAPYEEIDEVKYKELLSKFPKKLDWTKLRSYENDDTTESAKELACTGNTCEL